MIIFIILSTYFSLRCSQHNRRYVVHQTTLLTSTYLHVAKGISGVMVNDRKSKFLKLLFYAIGCNFLHLWFTVSLSPEATWLFTVYLFVIMMSSCTFYPSSVTRKKLMVKFPIAFLLYRLHSVSILSLYQGKIKTSSSSSVFLTSSNLYPLTNPGIFSVYIFFECHSQLSIFLNIHCSV